MKRLLLLTMAAAAIAGAQYPPPYDAPYGRGRYGGARDAGIIDRVQSDLNRAARSGYQDRHEWKHFQRAQEELYRFQQNWRRGRWDNRALDRAIENLDHLAHADRVHPRDRATLRDDLYELRAFRSSRGGYYSGYRY